MDTKIALANLNRSLEGLSVGDAFGQLFFRLSPYQTSAADLPSGSWRWTDDTHMALSIVKILGRYGRIEQDALAQAFARRFVQEPYRGYGGVRCGCSSKLPTEQTGGKYPHACLAAAHMATARQCGLHLLAATSMTT